MSLSDMIKVLKTVQFGTLYIKPAFVFADSNGHLKLQFEADPYSSMGYLYDNLCQMLGVKWNTISSYNSLGLYTSCAMHAAGDRASYGCGPSNANSGGFCPQMTIAYSPRFKSQEAAASYIAAANNYVDYWRILYPYGDAVGTDRFCRSKSSSGYQGGCLGLFLNRMDLYYVLAPDLSGAWVEFNGNSIAPTHSPAPTFSGGCDDPRNFHLDKCFRIKYSKQYASEGSGWWSSLGTVGQLTLIAVFLLSTVFIVALFIAQSRKQKKRALQKFFSSRKRKKRGDNALLAMEERYEIKRNYRQRSRSSRRSNSCRSQKGKQRFPCAALDLGTEDDTYDGINSTVYDPPKIQVIADVASNVLPNSNSDSSNFPKVAEPIPKTRAITSEIYLNRTSPQESILSGSARIRHAHATVSSIDFKKSPSHLSKATRSSGLTAKSISFYHWLGNELKARDESASEADAACAVLDLGTDDDAITSDKGANYDQPKSQGFSGQDDNVDVISHTITSDNSANYDPPKIQVISGQNDNGDVIPHDSNIGVEHNKEMFYTSPSISNAKKEPTDNQAEKKPATAFGHSIALDHLDSRRTSSRRLKISRCASSSAKGKAPSATSTSFLISPNNICNSDSGKGQVKEPSNIMTSLSNSMSESIILNPGLEPVTITGSSGLQLSFATVDVDVTQTPSNVSMSSRFTAKSRVEKDSASSSLKSQIISTHNYSSGIEQSNKPHNATKAISYTSPKDSFNLNQGMEPATRTDGSGLEHSSAISVVDQARTSSHVSMVSKYTARSRIENEPCASASLNFKIRSGKEPAEDPSNTMTSYSNSLTEPANYPAHNTYNSYPEMESTTSLGHKGIKNSITMADADSTQTSLATWKVTGSSTATTIKKTFQKVFLKFRDIKFLRKTS